MDGLFYKPVPVLADEDNIGGSAIYRRDGGKDLRKTFGVPSRT